jgi:hypothetical protein
VSQWQGLVPDADASSSSGREEGQEQGAAHRCSCGSLLARLVAGGVELKCRRCKRIVLLPFSTERGV